MRLCLRKYVGSCPDDGHGSFFLPPSFLFPLLCSFMSYGSAAWSVRIAYRSSGDFDPPPPIKAPPIRCCRFHLCLRATGTVGLLRLRFSPAGWWRSGPGRRPPPSRTQALRSRRYRLFGKASRSFWGRGSRLMGEYWIWGDLFIQKRPESDLPAL